MTGPDDDIRPDPVEAVDPVAELVAEGVVPEPVLPEVDLLSEDPVFDFADISEEISGDPQPSDDSVEATNPVDPETQVADLPPEPEFMILSDPVAPVDWDDDPFAGLEPGPELALAVGDPSVVDDIDDDPFANLTPDPDPASDPTPEPPMSVDDSPDDIFDAAPPLALSDPVSPASPVDILSGPVPLPLNLATTKPVAPHHRVSTDLLDGQASDYGYLALLRILERRAQGRPRIGRNRRTREELVRLGQDPFLGFPDTDLSAVDLTGQRPRVRSRFMGFFGPHGALPLNTTEEVLQWFEQGDTAFVEFTDIFASRFLQMFYRAWADARRITQFDHATDDRFQKYLLTFAGLGTPAFRDQSPDGDTTRLAYVALGLGRVRSPARLRQMLALQMRTKVEVEEMVPSWMEFEPDGLTRIGMQGSMLGRDMHLGSRIKSIGEKIRVHVHTKSLTAYYRFLPGGPDHRQLHTIVLGYLGQAFEVDVAVWLPADAVEPARLGASAQLGWMACVAPSVANDDPVLGTNYRLDLSPLTQLDERRPAA